jgi:hypothetical protein
MIEQKLPFYQTLTNFANKQIAGAISQIGKNLPCSVTAIEGSIVTVKFELTDIPYTLPEVQMPVVGFEYIRYPIQVGDRGYTVSADASIAGLTGLGTGVANLTNQGNLSMLAFVPLGCTNFFPVNANYLVMYGVDGVEIRNKSGSVTIVLTDSGVTINGKVTINGDVETTGTLKNNGVNVGSDHVHGGVNRGGVNTFVPQ